jgi:hypothetical protein
MKAGRYAVACQAIAESNHLDPRPGTLFTLATCEEGWGHLATAEKLYGDYLALYETLPEDRKAAQRESGRPKVAAEHREKLAPDVPELTLTLPPGAPAGTVVKRDRLVLAEPGVAQRVDPGEHVVSTQAPGGPVWEQTVTLAKGEKKTVVLEVRPAPTLEPAPVVAPPEPIPLEAGPSGRRVAGYVIGGAGLAGIAAGAVLGGLVFTKKGTIAAHCGAGIHSADDTACDATGLAAANAGKSLALGSSIALPLGVAALGAGLALRFTEPKPATQARAAAGVLSFSPTAVLLGARGTF